MPALMTEYSERGNVISDTDVYDVFKRWFNAQIDF